jgi:hypothetical protein
VLCHVYKQTFLCRQVPPRWQTHTRKQAAQCACQRFALPRPTPPAPHVKSLLRFFSDVRGVEAVRRIHRSHVTRHTSHVTSHTSESGKPAGGAAAVEGTRESCCRRCNHAQLQRRVECHTSHVTRHTSHVTCHMSHVTRHTSYVTRHTSHVTRHTSHVTRHTAHVTRHTSHGTRHTSHVTFSSSKIAASDDNLCSSETFANFSTLACSCDGDGAAADKKTKAA